MEIEKKVRQSNEFIEAPYVTELTIHEIKIIEYLIADCKEIDWELVNRSYCKPYSFSATQLANLLNTSKSRIIADGDKLSASITQKQIIQKVLNPDGSIKEFTYAPLITYAHYDNGIFQFELNYKILKYFVKINKNFTEYQLKYLLSMRSSYAIKLYKILYQYRNIGKRIFTLDELKSQFGVGEKYSQYGDFKRGVIDPSIRQINEITDLNISYNELKVAKKITKLEFTFNVIKQLPADLFQEAVATKLAQTKEKLPENIKAALIPIEEKISDKTIELLQAYCLQRGAEYGEASIKYAVENSKKNLDKYLQDTLLNEWAVVKVQELIVENEEKIKSGELERKRELEAQQEQENKLAREEKVRNKFKQLSEDDRTQVFAELVEKVTRKCPAKLPIILKDQEDYVIAYWATQQSLIYKGNYQLLLSTLKII